VARPTLRGADARGKIWRRFTSAFRYRLEVGFDDLAAKIAHIGGGKGPREILQRACERVGHTLELPTR